MEYLIKYSVLTIVVVVILRYINLITTPEQLERKHKDIIDEVEKKFVTWVAFNELKEQFRGMKDEVHAIYEHMIGGTENGR